MKGLITVVFLGIFLVVGYIVGGMNIDKKLGDLGNGADEEVIATNSVLDLSRQGLTQVPAYVFGRTDIEELNLSDNKLKGALPAEIRHLQNLKILVLSNNKFTGIPAEIGQLKNLEILDLSNNVFTGLPYELGNLSKLELLDLSGNKYSEADLANIRKNLPSSTVIKTD